MTAATLFHPAGVNQITSLGYNNVSPRALNDAIMPKYILLGCEETPHRYGI
jgi:hypothetical protein